jgi:hypothetical protein
MSPSWDAIGAGEGEGEGEYYPDQPTSGDQFIDYGENPFVSTEEDTLSTFSVDVDTASYTLARRELLAHHARGLVCAVDIRVVLRL